MKKKSGISQSNEISVSETSKKHKWKISQHTQLLRLFSLIFKVTRVQQLPSPNFCSPRSIISSYQFFLQSSMDHIIKGKAQVHLGKCDYFILKNLQAKDYVMFM